MSLGIQPIHIVFIFIVALLVFGPRRLPEMGRNIGKAINEIRRMTSGMTDIINQEMREPPGIKEPVILPPAGQAASEPAVVSSPPTPVAIQTPPEVPGFSRNYCIKCGAPNTAEALYCNHCGMKLPEKAA